MYIIIIYGTYALHIMEIKVSSFRKKNSKKWGFYHLSENNLLQKWYCSHEELSKYMYKMDKFSTNVHFFKDHR